MQIITDLSPTKRKGRPSSTESRNVFDSLLKAAEESLEEKDFREITVRELAARANVNPAMIRYYFKTKEGLFSLLIDRVFSEWESSL